MSITAPRGDSIDVRPVTPDEWDRITERCWPTEPHAIDALFELQDTIGMAAWHGDRCVAQLHGYRVVLPGQPNPHWPSWTNPWPDELWQQAIAPLRDHAPGAIWCHACCHVGRTLDSEANVQRELIYRFARQRDWNIDQTLTDLNALDGVVLEQNDVAQVVEAFRDVPKPQFQMIESQYHGRGIATALIEASIAWAKQNNYTAIIARAAPQGLREYAQWAGRPPWTTYAKLGFTTLAGSPEQNSPLDIDAWNVPPHIKDEARAAVSAGQSLNTLRPRIMALPISSEARDALPSLENEDA